MTRTEVKYWKIQKMNPSYKVTAWQWHVKMICWVHTLKLCQFLALVGCLIKMRSFFSRASYARVSHGWQSSMVTCTKVEGFRVGSGHDIKSPVPDIKGNPRGAHLWNLKLQCKITHIINFRRVKKVMCSTVSVYKCVTCQSIFGGPEDAWSLILTSPFVLTPMNRLKT